MILLHDGGTICKSASRNVSEHVQLSFAAYFILVMTVLIWKKQLATSETQVLLTTVQLCLFFFTSYECLFQRKVSWNQLRIARD